MENAHILISLWIIHLFIVNVMFAKLNGLIDSIKWYIFFFCFVALDSFKTLNNDNNVLNITEDNIAVISCELPNGNPRPVPLFTLNNNLLDVESKSSMTHIILYQKIIENSFIFLIRSI